MKKLFGKRFLAALLSLVMVAALATSAIATAVPEVPAKAKRSVTVTKVDTEAKLGRTGKADAEKSKFADTDVVRVSIVLPGNSVIGAGYSAKNVAANKSAMSYRSGLKANQDALAARISKNVLDGAELDVVWNLTLAANIISANVPYGKIEAIKNTVGVKDVVLETEYLPETDESGAANPENAVSTQMTNNVFAWAAGYTGAGSKVAIVDTGLDTAHRSFNADAFLYAIEELNAERAEEGKDPIVLMTEDDIAEVWDELNIADRLGSIDGIYRNAKIPFGANYVDNGLDVTHVNDTQGEHGSHVAGIATANKYVIDEETKEFVPAIDAVKAIGEAPDAQVLVMKVFGKGGGAYDSDYMAAIEDAMVLGADSVNLSLGSSAAGFTTNSTYAEIIASLEEADIIWANSAGNNYSWNHFTNVTSEYGYDLLNEGDINYHTGGSPATYKNSLAVASVDNDGQIGATIEAAGKNIFFTETSGYGNKPLTGIAGEYKYVYVDTPGTDADFAAVADILEGAVALCNRGSTSFYQKANAAIANGAVATVIVNNQAGVINMNLTGYTYTAPAVSITLADGAAIKASSEKLEGYGFDVYVGTLTINEEKVAVFYDSEFKTMSDFSSWGGNGALTIKPEITAPGGNIWSVNGDHYVNATDNASGHNNYEIMSGTSMASPQIAGIAAVVAQYIRENGGVAEGMSQRQLAQSLLMSTAKPLTDEYGYYYSIMHQGAGLVDVNAVINARSYILMDESATASAADGKVKAEIGEIERGEDFTVAFDLVNFSDAPILYNLSADFFTQYIDYGFRWNDTDFINAAIVWTVNDEEINPVPGEYDFDGNGIVNVLDAEYLLDYLAGKTTVLYNEEYADLDEDQDVDTHDAYLAFQLLNTIETVLDGGETAHIEATVTLDFPEEYDVNGNWIEGYMFVKEGDTEDGALGVVHSIPVLGFWGSITESSMFDSEETYVPGGVAEPEFYDGNRYALGGNPFFENNEQYSEDHPERSAINPDITTVGGIRYTQIRNAGAARFYVSNQYGRIVPGSELTASNTYGAFYNQNQGVWQQITTNMSFNAPIRNVKEGQRIAINYELSPEYYIDAEGNVDWDKVGDGAKLSLALTVDTRAPQIVNASVVEEEGVKYLVVEAHDENYIAAMAVFDENGNLLTATPSDNLAISSGLTEEYRKGDQVYAAYDLSEFDEDVVATGHYLVQVYDYATNYASYKLNTNPEELEEPVEVSVKIDQGEEITIVGKGTAQLTATVLPWGFEFDDVVFTVEEQVDAETDEEAEIITITDDGFITVVSDVDGFALVRATSEYDPEAYAEITVEVKFIDKELNGIVWDENGEVWFTDFNLKTLPDYTKLHENNMRLQLTGTAYDQNGTLYAATFDSNNWTSDLYTVDPETFETKKIGSSEIGFMDITSAPSLGDNHLLAVYGTYVLIVNKDTGVYEGVFNLSSFTGGNYLVGIAYEEQYDHPNYGNTDWVWLLDEGGNIYNTGFLPVNGSYSRFGVTKIGQIGDAVDIPYWQSLYYDGESLYWSRFNEADDYVEIIMVNDVYNDGSIYTAGRFADTVWPVGGLFELGINPATGFTTVERPTAVVEEPMSTERIAKIDFNKKSGGSLNSIKELEPSAQLNSVKTDTVIDVEVPANTTNGLIVVDYDPAKVTGFEYVVTADHFSVKESTGKLVVAYVYDIEEALEEEEAEPTVSADADVEADEKTVLELYFAYGSEGIVLITEEELNNEHPATETKVFLGGYPVDPIPEDYSEPVWTWNEDLTAAYATFTRSDGATKTVDAEIEVEEVEADCENDGLITYTATVEFNGETYTDTVEVVTEAIGHNYGDPTWKWSDDKTSATAAFVCENDESHVETVEAVVELELTETENGLVNVYTATAEFNGEEYTDIIEVSGVFAGWYKDMAFTDPYTETPAEDDVKYAKLVAPETFGIIVQVDEPAPDAEDAKIRVITSVDSVEYQSVEFVLTYGDNELKYTTSTFYEHLTAALTLEAIEDPKSVFSADSELFASKKIKLPADAFNQTVKVKAIFTTCDGTVFESETVEFTVEMNAVFAGWYHDAEFTDPFTAQPEEGEEAYAKYVHKDTFKTIVQVVEPEEGDTTIKIRVISSVDTVEHDNVTFHIEYADATMTFKTTTFYEHITEALGLEGFEDPKEVFTEDSELFASKKVSISDSDAFGKEITVYAVITTADGTVITGEPTVITLPELQ